jgi:lysophospholipase L1-like esterase
MGNSSGVTAPRRTALGIGLTTLATVPARAQSGAAGHIVLLGDSIFANKAYVAGGSDVVAHLRARLPTGWQATLAAADGAVAADVRRQLDRAPREASHLVVSVGGNDALRQEGVLREPARSVSEALARLAGLADRFREDYRAMLGTVLGRGLPTAICTIYDPRFPDPLRQRLAVAGLAQFNDVIAREAFLRGLPLIDLRLVCNEDADFANPIEPSVQGGRKIAAAIARLAKEHDFGQRRATVYGGIAG